LNDVGGTYKNSSIYSFDGGFKKRTHPTIIKQMGSLIMKNKAIRSLLSKVSFSGMYNVDLQIDINSYIQCAEKLHYHIYRINGLNISDKNNFLNVFSISMKFPTYFGNNWDAFEECITDFEGQNPNGIIIVYENFLHFYTNSPDQFTQALKSLKFATEFWRDQGIPMFVLLIDAKFDTNRNFENCKNLSVYV